MLNKTSASRLAKQSQRFTLPVAHLRAGWENWLMNSSERTWAILAHLSAIIAMLVSAGWLSFIGPLIVWAVKKNDSPAVRTAAAGAFNFNIGMWLMTVAGWICFFTLILIPLAAILWIMAFALTIFHHIRASIAVSNNQVYHYPWQIPILK